MISSYHDFIISQYHFIRPLHHQTISCQCLISKGTWQLDLVNPEAASGHHFRHGRPDTASTLWGVHNHKTMMPGNTHHNAGLCPFTNPSLRHFRTSKSSYKHVQTGLSRCKKRRQSLSSLLLGFDGELVLQVFLFAFVAKDLPVKNPAFSPNCRKISKAVCLREALSMIYLR